MLFDVLQRKVTEKVRLLSPRQRTCRSIDNETREIKCPVDREGCERR